MNGGDEDDRPTVVLDLNALKKQKLKQEEELANIASELEFNVEPTGPEIPQAQKSGPKLKESTPQFTVILFDLQSDFFKKSKSAFPQGYNYKVLSSLQELNQQLRLKEFQIAVFNYDVNPKAVNQLCAQIKLKFPDTKTIIIAKAISPEKAKAHAKTPSGASGYYQLPLEPAKIEKEFLKIHSSQKKVG